MKRMQSMIPAFAAAALLGLGSFVLVGWFVQRAGLVQLQPGMFAMVANTALCFVLSGSGLLLLASQRAAFHPVVRLIAVIVGLIAAAVLLQVLLPVPWHLDSPGLHAWLADGNPNPGRMAPNTCIGFLLGAGALWALASPHPGDHRPLLRLTLFALLLTGLTGFVGYWLRIDVVLGWRHVRMALPTASGMLVLAAGLWMVLERRSTPDLFPEKQITRSAAVVLTVAVLLSGLAGFTILVGQTESVIQVWLKQRLEFRVELLEEALQSARDANAALAANPELVQRVANLTEDPAPPGSRISAAAPLVDLPSSGVRGLRVTAQDGRLLAQQGVIAPATEFDVPLDRTGSARLIWDGMLVLRTRPPLRNASGNLLATMVVDRPLPSLAGRLTEKSGFGRTGEVNLCGKVSPRKIVCFPEERQPRGRFVPLTSDAQRALPSARAASGHSGVSTLLDYRGQVVVAAYTPVAGGSLGMVVKQDTAEIYSPIRDRLRWMLPMLALMVGAGLLLMWLQVRPLARVLARSERDSRLARDELSAVVNTISDGMVTADAQGVILSANHAAERIFGYMGDLIGRDLKTLMPAEYHAAHDAGMARYLVDGTRRVIGRGNVELVGQRQDGGQFPLELSIDTIVTADGLNFVGVVRDITARRQAQQALLLEKERLRVTLHSIADAVITTDTHGVVTYLNPMAEHLTGWSSLEAEGERIGTVFKIAHQRTGDTAPSPVDVVLTTGSTAGLANDTMLMRRNGSQVAIEDSASAIRDSEGSTVGVVLVFHDVSHAREIAVQMSHQATHDALTDLINRREFEHQVLSTLSGDGPQDKGHILLYMDLDQFKVVNDTSGHVAGDELLKQVASVLRGKLRDQDQLARLGGDEFGVLLRNCPVDAGLRIADSLRQAILELGFAWKDRAHAIGASIGVVPFVAGGSLTDLLSAADAACYVAKDKGRNRIHLHLVDDADIVQRAGEMDWASRIRAALAEDRFVLYGQQIAQIAAPDAPAHTDPGPLDFDRQTDRPREVTRDAGLHYEVLVRMVDEAGGLVPPMAFIPAAERYGLMPAIDRWVVNASLACLSATHDGLHMGTKLSINLSGKTLGDDTFIEFVEAAFRRHRIAYPQVCFEITETAAIANLAQAGQFINWFRQHGCQFSLDDFGSGMSSFGYLKHLRVDAIKIDGGFVKDLLDDAVDEAMVVAINNIGHALGLQTVAEFVENGAILRRLQQLGVDHAQGYGIHVPHPLRTLLGLDTGGGR